MCFGTFKGFSLSYYSTKLLLSTRATFTELRWWLYLKSYNGDHIYLTGCISIGLVNSVSCKFWVYDANP